ncbi:hypothetical protein Trydic_g17309 [Trypoxylus dichotomus]
MQVPTRNTLDKLHRLACVCISEAIRTCPTAVLKVILDLTPVHIVVEGVAHAVRCRLGRGLKKMRLRSRELGHPERNSPHF